MRRARIPAALTALLLTGAALAGCTSDSGSGGSGSGLTGPPVVVGFVNMEGAATGSFPESRAGAQAAVDHVNDDLGGVAGRPLRLETCTTSGTPESSLSCAQTLVGKAPVAVVGGVDLGAESSVPLVTGAGIPYVTGSPTLIGELRNDGAFAFTGGVAGDLLAIGQQLVDRGTQRIAVVHADLPGLLNAAVTASGTVLRSRGVADLQLVPEKVDAGDFAPALRAALKGDPQALIVVFPPQSCARILSAASSLDLPEVYVPGACASTAAVQAAGPAVSKVTFASGYEPVPADGGDADAAAFRSRVPQQQQSPLSQAAYSSVMNLYGLMKGGAADAAALRSALAAASDAPNVFAHPYTCDGKQVPLLPSVCNADVRLLQYRDGRYADVGGDWVNGTGLVRGLGG